MVYPSHTLDWLLDNQGEKSNVLATVEVHHTDVTLTHIVPVVGRVVASLLISRRLEAALPEKEHTILSQLQKKEQPELKTVHELKRECCSAML